MQSRFAQCKECSYDRPSSYSTKEPGSSVIFTLEYRINGGGGGENNRGVGNGSI